MDAKELLRQYLEQRRELGEREFVLDSLTVEDAMKAIGVRRDAAPGASERADVPRPPRNVQPAGVPRGPLVPPTPKPREAAVENDDWREALRAAGAAPMAPPAGDATPGTNKASEPGPRAAKPADAESTSAAVAPLDATVSSEAPIVVGSAARDLFGGPLSHVTTLDDIAKLVAECRACPLHATAKNAVPGEGNPAAEFVCVGEAPGQSEDESGRPFVGRAGSLLTDILAAIKLKREDVFICNVLKHRPPGNRNPAPDEIVACRPFLMRQLELLKPRVILALGTFAAQTLLESKLSIGKLRGKVHTFYGIPLVVTYHPAALLRNPAWKRPTWEDVQLARRLLDRPNGGP